MRQLYCLLLILVILISCDNENPKEITYYDNDQSKWIVKFNSLSDTTDKTITGYYNDNTKKCERNLKGGKENGKQTAYFSNGKIETICNKKDDVQHGLSQIFFSNGKLSAQGDYFNGYREGEWELSNSEGEIFVRNYHKDTLHGFTKEIKNNGSVVFGQFNKGIEQGEWITKSKDSIVTMMTTYKNGVLNGSVKQFYSTGEIYVDGYYDKGFKEGKWKIYNKTGLIDTVEVYKKDILIEYKQK